MRATATIAMAVPRRVATRAEYVGSGPERARGAECGLDEETGPWPMTGVAVTAVGGADAGLADSRIQPEVANDVGPAGGSGPTSPLSATSSTAVWPYARDGQRSLMATSATCLPTSIPMLRIASKPGTSCRKSSPREDQWPRSVHRTAVRVPK